MKRDAALHEADNQREPRSLAYRLVQHFLQQWSSALLVTSVCTIAILQFGLLKAADIITFPVFGYFSSLLTEAEYRPRAVVVEIDQHTFDAHYLGRSPLDRCVLFDQLQQIYAARPDVVAIDIDLSPALWLNHPEGILHPQANCQQEIYQLILGQASSQGENLHRIATVMMQPAAISRKFSAEKIKWLQQMSLDQPTAVRFGDAELPVSFGITILQAARPAPGKHPGLAAVVADFAQHPAADHWIDPRGYRSRLKLLPIDASAEFSHVLADALAQTQRWNINHKRVVFFGTAYGDDYFFRTAIGKLYGVEVHAGAYVSDPINEHPLLDFCLDYLIAISFGILISWFWNRYFDYSLSDNPTRQLRSRLWVIGLLSITLLLMILLGTLSVSTLAQAGIWIAPVPIAAGMLFDSFVSGTIEKATERLRGTPHSAIKFTPLLRQRQLAAAFLYLTWTFLWFGIVIWALTLVTTRQLGAEH